MVALLYTVWKTEHYINRFVTEAFYEGLLKHEPKAKLRSVSDYNPREVKHAISYGILRGTDSIYKLSTSNSQEYWEIDRGYFKPAHFEGYYRVSKNDLRASYVKGRLPTDRFEMLRIHFAPWRTNGKHILVCPPTAAVAQFTGLDLQQWIISVEDEIHRYSDRPIIIRGKDSKTPLQQDLHNCHCVITYNSNVAIDALLAGIPVISLDYLTDIYPWNRLRIHDIETDGLCVANRADLFSFLSYCQFTLEEFKAGKAWELCQTVQG